MLGFDCFHEAATLWRLGEAEHATDLPPEALRVDLPGVRAITEAKYWRRVLLAHPRAKVVLTTRASDAWFTSIARHTDRIHARLESVDPSRGWRADQAHAMYFGNAWPSKTLWCERKWLHEFAVERWCVERGREFMAFDPTLGVWGGLPAFLGVPQPAERFPWLNRCAIDVSEDIDKKAGEQ